MQSQQVDGVDLLGFGANDFTAEIGAPGDYSDPRVTSAVETLAGAAHRHRKLLMVGGIGDPARLRELDQPGVCPLRLTGTDTDMLYAGAAARAERFTKNG
jgi:2-keto-3-deoxy-L-rhamnonate aldolase RhmA